MELRDEIAEIIRRAGGLGSERAADAILALPALGVLRGEGFAPNAATSDIAPADTKAPGANTPTPDSTADG